LTLTFASIMASAGIDQAETVVIRHAYMAVHTDGTPGINADTSDEGILNFTSTQALSFPATSPRRWVVFLPEGGDRARLWRVVINHGQVGESETQRHFNLEVSDELADLRSRLVIHWRSPRTWRIKASTAAAYSVLEIAEAQPVRFPGFDSLILDHGQLQAVVREYRYASWRTALSSVHGVYLITDTRDGRNYVGKADGAESILQRWSAYATNGHGGNVELKRLDPSTFRFSLLRVFDPATPEAVVNAAESHFKRAIDSIRHGLNRG